MEAAQIIFKSTESLLSENGGHASNSESPALSNEKENDDTEAERVPVVAECNGKTKKLYSKKKSFVSKGDIVPCMGDAGSYWLFRCSSKAKTNGKVKGKWLDATDQPRCYVIFRSQTEIDERVVLVRDNKRMIVPPSYFDEIDEDNGRFTISISGHSIISDIVKKTIELSNEM